MLNDLWEFRLENEEHTILELGWLLKRLLSIASRAAPG